MYEKVFRMFVDRTIAIYLCLLAGYVLSGLFIVNDLINVFEKQFLLLNNQAPQYFWSVLLVIPLLFLLQSFRHPGVLFSSSELQLSRLPYSKRLIWWYLVFEKWLKSLFIYGSFGLLLVWLTPLSREVVIQYILLFILMNIMMTLPQWKLFQKSFITKVGYTCFYLIMLLAGLVTSSRLLGVMVVLGILAMNMRCARTLFHDVHWNRVTEVGDYVIWKMPFVERASGISYKRQNQYSIFQRVDFLKKPFVYTEEAIHRRLWLIYFGKQIDSVLKFIGSLFLLLIILAFMGNDVPMWFGIAISIYIYSSVIATFYKEYFQNRLLEVLPWNLQINKKTCLQWTWIGSIPLTIPLIIYIVPHASFWIPFQIVFIYCTFYFLYDTKIDRMISRLIKQNHFFQTRDVLGIVFLFMVLLNGLYPFLSLGFVIVLWFIKKGTIVWLPDW